MFTLTIGQFLNNYLSDYSRNKFTRFNWLKVNVITYLSGKEWTGCLTSVSRTVTKLKKKYKINLSLFLRKWGVTVLILLDTFSALSSMNWIRIWHDVLRDYLSSEKTNLFYNNGHFTVWRSTSTSSYHRPSLES